MDSAQSTGRIEELLQEDQNVKRRRERYQKQSSLLSKLTRQLSIHDNRASAASSFSNGGAGMYIKAVLSSLTQVWMQLISGLCYPPSLNPWKYLFLTNNLTKEKYIHLWYAISLYFCREIILEIVN